MPAKQKYPTPAQGMRIHLAAALRRGEPFDHAWADGYEQIRYPHALAERLEWEAALTDTEPAWRAAYEQQLDEFDRVFSALDPLNGPIELQAVA